MTWRAQAASAVKRAATLRAQLGYGPADALCPFDFAARLDLEVRFIALPSLEGMYDAARAHVVLNSLRPSGRRRYTCSHEVGHHVHGHGTSFDGADQLVANQSEEFVANLFARALLMPKLAVAAAFARRGWRSRETTAEQAFVVAQDLGVGFTTLLDQMSMSLNLLGRAQAVQLSKTRLPQLRETFVPGGAQYDVFPLDRHWGARPLELEVGDVVIAPDATRVVGTCVTQDGPLLRAHASGYGEIIVPGRSAPIAARVSRRDFVGRACFRHLEEVDD